jgi:uncharacterized protein (DUF1778 family)
MRLIPDQDALIRDAAVACGHSLTDVVTRSAVERVEDALEAADIIGVRLLLVHALKPRARAFYESLGFTSSPTDPLHLSLLLADDRSSL